MMDAIFQDALNFHWRPENDGQGPHVTPGDSGGVTSWGMTYAVWVAWRKLQKMPFDLSSFCAQPRMSFAPIYAAQYWNALRCDQMGPLAVQVFDTAVLSGTHTAAVMLQRQLKDIAADGFVGPATLAALAEADQSEVNLSLWRARNGYYRTVAAANSNDAQFLDGWLRRAEDCVTYVRGIMTPTAA